MMSYAYCDLASVLWHPSDDLGIANQSHWSSALSTPFQDIALLNILQLRQSGVLHTTSCVPHEGPYMMYKVKLLRDRIAHSRLGSGFQFLTESSLHTY